MRAFLVFCPDCGARMSLKEGQWGLFYACSAFPACQMSCKANSDGIPIARPAGRTTRAARIEAHVLFDRLWKKGNKKRWLVYRTRAYRWLRRLLDIQGHQAHIGKLGHQDCEKLIEACREKLGEENKAYGAKGG